MRCVGFRIYIRTPTSMILLLQSFVKYSFSFQLINAESKRLQITFYISSGIFPGNTRDE